MLTMLRFTLRYIICWTVFNVVIKALPVILLVNSFVFIFFSDYLDKFDKTSKSIFFGKNDGMYLVKLVWIKINLFFPI